MYRIFIQEKNSEQSPAIEEKANHVSNNAVKQTKVVNCAVDQYGQLLYLHVADKESLQKSADRTQIEEEAYNKFTTSKESDATSEGDIVDIAATDFVPLMFDKSLSR